MYKFTHCSFILYLSYPDEYLDNEKGQWNITVEWEKNGSLEGVH